MSRALLIVLLALPATASAHDLKLPLRELQSGVKRIGLTLSRLKASPALPPLPRTPDENRRVLGAAEIERALGNKERALQMLLGRLADPAFQTMPEYPSTLLLASEILERTDDEVGAMSYARLALVHGGTPDEMAEAGSRWFRLARRHLRLSGRLAVLDLWRRRGGEKAAGPEIAAETAYEAAYALWSDGKFPLAQSLLAKVPSESLYGSRAAYLAGVLHVESGDSASAERWFSSIMDWPILDDAARDPKRRRIEVEVRELATLQAARLRYERNDLEGADAAYRRIPESSGLIADACYELAFLDMERKHRRGALMHLQCVLDVGAGGERGVDVRLMIASIRAHQAKYEESVETYQVLGERFTHERDALRLAAATIDKPAEFLFENMDQSTLRKGPRATPGPAAVFGDAWTSDVDLAYRVDRELRRAHEGLDRMIAEVDQIRVRLEGDDTFPGIELRRFHYRRILQEIQHLQGHAGEMALTARHHASAPGGGIEHSVEAAEASVAEAALGAQARSVEQELVGLDRQERERRATADALLTSIRQEASALGAEAEAIARDAALPIDGAARQAIQAMVKRLEAAVMRTESGVLDTYWVRKEHVSQKIRQTGTTKKEVVDQFDRAILELERE